MYMERTLKTAVGQVMKQVRPQTARPSDGDSEKVTEQLLPVVRTYFGLPAYLDADGSPEHLDRIISEDTYTLLDCLYYPRVMDHHIKQRRSFINMCTGRSIIDPDEFYKWCMHDL